MKYETLKYVCDHSGHPMNPMLGNLLVYTDEHGHQRAQAQNGRFTVDVPTDLPSMLVNADRAVAVWSACKTEPQVKLTATTLSVAAGNLKARIGLQDPNQYPRVTKDTEHAHTAASLADVLKVLQPFVATDAARPWATAVCLGTQFAYATNNVVLVRIPFFGLDRPVNLPGSSIDAILERPIFSVSEGTGSLTFNGEDGSWVKTQLVDGDWPTAVVDGLITGIDKESAWLDVNDDLEPMLRVASKLADARHPVVCFKGTHLMLEDESLVADNVGPIPDEGRVNANMAALVFEYATQVQWHTPKQNVHAFRAGKLVGVFGGQR